MLYLRLKQCTVIIFLLFVSGVAMAQDAATSTPVNMAQTSIPFGRTETKMDRKLKATIKQFVVKKAKLSEALDQWQKLTDIPMRVDWSNITKYCKINPDTRISLSLENVPADYVIKALFEELNVTRDLHKKYFTLDYDLTPWHLLITSMHKIPTRVEIYNISRLLIIHPKPKDTDNTESPNKFYGPGNNSELFGLDEDERDSVESQISELMELIQISFGQQNWDAFGGDRWSIRSFNHLLIVKTSDRTHRQIAELFNALEKQLKTDSPQQSLLLELQYQ